MPFSVGVGGSSGSSGSSGSWMGRTPRGKDLRSALPLKGSNSSSSCADGGGKGRGDGWFSDRRGFPRIPPRNRRFGLCGSDTSASAPILGCIGSDAGRFSDAPSSCAVNACSSTATLPALVERLCSGALGCPSVRDALRCSSTSGFARTRLALVGDAKEGRRLLLERLVAPLDDDRAEPSDPLNRTLVVGEVLRRLGAASSIFLLGYPGLIATCLAVGRRSQAGYSVVVCCRWVVVDFGGEWEWA